jgi:hypothetical protein
MNIVNNITFADNVDYQPTERVDDAQLVMKNKEITITMEFMEAITRLGVEQYETTS